MSWEGREATVSIRWQMQRARCWLRAMLAHFDNLLAAALADAIVRGSGLKACHAKLAAGRRKQLGRQ